MPAVAIKEAKEPWTEYVLEDGTKIMTRLSLVDFIRTDQYNELGEPVYQFKLSHSNVATIPDALKRKAVTDI